NIIALSRQKNQESWFNKLGAQTIQTIDDVTLDSNKPLNTQKFDYILDSVGGDIAAKLLPFLSYGGSMSMCGHAAGVNFQTTVFPMILRGVNILGIDSVGITHTEKQNIWQSLAELNLNSSI